jgi:U5 small nuclear ribonucleoprotein component
MLGTSKMIEMAMLEKLPLTLVINKVDRLILELKLPPNDAYYKLVHTIEEVNALVLQYWAATGGHGGVGTSGDKAPRLSPERGNVCFASSAHGWCFSLLSFAKVVVVAFSANARF